MFTKLRPHLGPPQAPSSFFLLPWFSPRGRGDCSPDAGYHGGGVGVSQWSGELSWREAQGIWGAQTRGAQAGLWQMIG